MTDVLEANNIKDDFGMANVIHILSEPVLEDLKGAIDEQIQRSFTNYANIDFDNLIDTFETSTNGIPN